MLCNDLERAVWAAVYARECNVSDCYKRADDWARTQPVTDAMTIPQLAGTRWAFEEAAVTASACELADAAILRLRRHIINNEEMPRTPHVLLGRDYLTNEGALDFDVELED